MHQPACKAARRTGARCAAALLLGAATSLLAAPARADDVLVAVAANFAGPLQKIAEGFAAATGHVVRPSAGATGKLYTQIAAGGAPFEVLLSADDTTPRRLVAEGHAVAGSQFTYAIGQLVLWSATPGLVDDRGAVLAAGRFSKLAIANPRTAPYGAAAQAVIQALGLKNAVTPRLVTADSIAQAYQFVATGNADLGFVALSQVAVPGKPVAGSMWKVPPTLHGAIRQDAVLLKRGEHSAAAKALLAYLQSAPARAVMRAHGYGP
jgi:molybdate transport system substrate-binding protein